jgi:hypothetical protein
MRYGIPRCSLPLTATQTWPEEAIKMRRGNQDKGSKRAPKQQKAEAKYGEINRLGQKPKRIQTTCNTAVHRSHCVIYHQLTDSNLHRCCIELCSHHRIRH